MSVLRTPILPGHASAIDRESGATPERQRDGALDRDHAAFVQTKSFQSLDGLRALAILAVLWHHHADHALPGLAFTARGFLGVDLFFIISGFLITTLLLREKSQTGTISLRGFYLRRFLRILPPYYLMLLVVAATAFLKPGATGLDAVRHDLPYAVFFLSNLVPMQSLLAITWSLSVEEQFYLLAPTLEKRARRILPYLFPVAYVMVSLPLFAPFDAAALPSFFKETTFGPILLGVMLAHALDAPGSFGLLRRLAGWRPAPMIFAVLAVVAASSPVENFTGWSRLLAHWALLALVASCVVREDNLLAPLLRSWPLRRIGVVSYGIYLYHLLTMHFVVKALDAAGVPLGHSVFVANTFASWAVAEISYRLFEVRFLELKARLAPKAAAGPGGMAIRGWRVGS